MDFDYAAELAERIRHGENGGLRTELLTMCIRYFSGLRTRWGFYWISRQEVEELASDAINATIFTSAGGKTAFWIRLQNAFRKCCRQRNRWRHQSTMETLAKKCGLERLVAVPGSQPPADVGMRHKELIELIHREVEEHQRASQTAIRERIRGASYEEIAMILGRDAHRSRALFWDDIQQIRKNGVLMRYLKNEDWSSVIHFAPPVGED